MSNLSSYRLLSFDVYGTLIDWETGILKAFEPLLSANSASSSISRSQLLSIYHELESAQQIATPSKKYSEILEAVHPQVAQRLGFTHLPTQSESKTFGASISSWPAFPDTVSALHRLSKHYKLVVLSNVDRDSFTGTNAGPLAGVKFDAVLTAQDIGSYKPSLRNFEYMLEYVRREFGVEKDQVLQTAQSQFHDHHPAKEMGIRSVWIVRPGGEMGNREREVYDWRFDTLGEMADALEVELGEGKGKGK